MSQKLGTVASIGALLVGLFVVIPPAAAARLCYGKVATIVGSDRADRFEELIGTPGPDVIVGRDGDDTIYGRGGNDRICAGEGFDLINGGDGNDRIHGGTGSDTINAGRGADRVDAGRGSVEALFGHGGADVLNGGPGAFDGLIGGRGNDVMDGGPGLDAAHFFDSPGPIVADLTSDRVTGRGSDVIANVEGIVGSNFDDMITGDDGSNLLVGQEGNDTIEARGSGSVPSGQSDLLDGGPGDDLLNGGEGGDIVAYEDSPFAVMVDLGEGKATGWGTDVLTEIEAAIGSDLDDQLVGDDGDNSFLGGPGDDTIDGGVGIDEMAYFDARAPVTIDLAAGTASGWGEDLLSNIENLTGSAGADTISGDAGANTIVGGSGNDSLSGAAGDDVLIGAAGSDAANGGEGSDSCEAEIEAECETDPFSYQVWRGARLVHGRLGL